MYERSAIVLERYFNQLFGYNMKNNVKTNFEDYCELVQDLEKYKNISEEEETIIQEYDAIANKIREKQKIQENLNKKNNKLQEEMNNIFQNIDENTEVIQKKIENLCSNIQTVNEQIKENAQDFVDIVAEFGEKSAIRTSCGKTRRNIESEYNKKLNDTLDNYQDIDINIQKRVKSFIETDTEKLEKELKEKLIKNGENEKIPFNKNVITKAITLSVDIQKRETEILASSYDRTNKLFLEIKNNSTKIDKHKKYIKDSKSKLEFISAIKEYLVQFIDNERLTAVNGESEHKKLMDEACKNLDEDLQQINNLYTLLLKEIAKKITKKSYSDLYNLNYLIELEKKAEEFDNEIKKLNLSVTIINPNHWRIDGMKKIYDVFYNCVTEYYERDLSEYMPKEEVEEEPEEDFFESEEEIEEETKVVEEKNESKANTTKSEIDKKIDMILGFGKEDEDFSEEENDEQWDDEDLWNDDDDIENIDDEGEDEDIFEDEEDDEDDEYDDDEDLIFDEEDYDDDEKDEEIIDEEHDDEEIYHKRSNNKKNSSNSKRGKHSDDNWENEFVKIEKKEKKKKSFFDKFKKG